MLERLDETIVAISSAPGRGPMGIVRLSGPNSFPIADEVCALHDGSPLRSRPGFTRVEGDVFLDSAAAVPATFYLFRAPRSYTRQDLVEIHSIGAPSVLELIRERLLARGALAAEPGEFTARAFLHGAMDLASAEAVAGIIRAQSDTQLRAARRMMDGTLTQRISHARDDLAELLALVEADIDFAEEPIEFITPPVLRAGLSRVEGSMRALMAGAETTERFDVLPRILLLGPPNAGKSSLMNRLSGTSRSICAAAAGTTRDILAASILLPVGEAVLLDSAGVDATDDEVIAAARAITFSTAQTVDLVCAVVDATYPRVSEPLPWQQASEAARRVIALNKCDLLSPEEIERVVPQLRGPREEPICVVSALNGTGIESLRQAMAAALGEREQTTLGEAVLLSQRQRAALLECAEALRRAMELCQAATETIDCADVVAFELREALDALGAVTGEVTTEDLLGQVFARFCIGK